MSISFERIPNSMFLPAYLVRDIRKASILPREKRKPGEPDVVLQSPLGFTERIYRKDLAKRFMYLNGKNIHMAAWKRNKAYLVMTVINSNNKFYAVKVPSNKEIKANGRILKNSSSYVICKDIDGQLDKNNVYIASSKIFKKMFTMKGNLKDANNIRSASTVNRQNIVSDNTARIPNINAEQQSRPTIHTRQLNNSQFNTNNEQLEYIDNTVNSKDDREFNVISRLTLNGKVVGYGIVDKNGNKNIIKKQEMNLLVRAEKVNKLAIRNTSIGEVIYGIGMRINDLPEVKLDNSPSNFNM